MPLPEVGRMPLVYYLRLRRDAFVAAMRATRGGREYLENAMRIAETGFDAAGAAGLVSAAG